jgi:uncharacterized protein YcbK (DUF882 family)
MKLSKYFSEEELCCKCGCGLYIPNKELLDVLDSIREYFDSPVYINSGVRCAAHNTKVGGMPGSKHLTGEAADIVVANTHARCVQRELEETFKGKYGIGRYGTFTHIDVRKRQARWGDVGECEEKKL